LSGPIRKPVGDLRDLSRTGTDVQDELAGVVLSQLRFHTGRVQEDRAVRSTAGASTNGAHPGEYGSIGSYQRW
jgi:hypothetical protein